jgi:male-specific lethal 3
VLRELYTWKLVPEPVYFEEPVPASLVYGGVHLVRLMVRIHEIFSRMRFTAAKLKLVMRYMEALVDYLNTQPDLFCQKSSYSRAVL